MEDTTGSGRSLVSASPLWMGFTSIPHVPQDKSQHQSLKRVVIALSGTSSEAELLDL